MVDSVATHQLPLEAEKSADLEALETQRDSHQEVQSLVTADTSSMNNSLVAHNFQREEDNKSSEDDEEEEEDDQGEASPLIEGPAQLGWAQRPLHQQDPEVLSEHSTTSHRVSRALYGEVDQNERDWLQGQIILSILLDFVIYVVPIGLLGSRVHWEAECGVPLTRWLVGLLMIISIANLQKLMMYSVVQYCRASRFIYGVVSSSFVFILLFSWLVYGNLIYFSRKNDCVRNKDTRLLAHLVLGYLYVGYIQIGYALSYAYVLPTAILKWYQLRSRDHAFQRSLQQISQTLARKDFDPLMHKYEQTCAICLDNFHKLDQVTTLECHTKHIFHSVCLDRWINQSRNTCPVCREDIITEAIDRTTYNRETQRDLYELRRDEDVQRLAQCPFGWPF